MNKFSLANIADKINAKSLALAVALTMPMLAHADTSKYAAASTEVDKHFEAGETAVATVSASAIEIYVIRRVWRIIRSSI